nr:helix-turn-helix transcriptional regulator [Desulfosporosinus meridiei]
MTRFWLANIRINADMTHEEVAKMVGVKRQYYSMIENGERTPSVKVAQRIGEVLNFKWTLFFEENSNKAKRYESDENEFHERRKGECHVSPR